MTDTKGKQKKKYLYNDMMTPYEKLRSLSRPSQFLKQGVTFKSLDAYAKEMNGSQAAEQLNSARNLLFKSFMSDLRQLRDKG